MPVQKFAPMTKDFATFDCDAHITEPPAVWERAHEHLTQDELEALKATCWWDSATQQLFINGKGGAGAGIQNVGGTPGAIRVTTVAGPGLKHDIQRAFHVRNLDPETALTQEQAAYLDHAGSYEPKARLHDMDAQGIDQVMVIPTNFDTYPWMQNSLGAKAFCKAYNSWAYEYTLENPERLYFAALLPVQECSLCRGGSPPRGRSRLPCRLDSPHRRDGQLPGLAQVRTPWGRHGRSGHGLRYASLPSLGSEQATRLYRAVLRRGTHSMDRADIRPAAHVFGEYAGIYGGSLHLGDYGVDVGVL